MRRTALIMALAMLAGCGQKPAAEEANGAAGPNIGGTLVPGVSLTYQYGFRLPAERVVSVQEAHAARCEALTPARCRITGLVYDVHRNRTITASLQMKLAPEIARGFGKQGVEAVLQQGGMLTSSRIDSEEAGAVAEAADRDAAALSEERARIEAQLARTDLGSAERRELQQRMAELSDQKRAAIATKDEAARKLANTPMTFFYESGDVDPGLNDGPILGAIKDGWANIVAGFSVILMLVVTLLPLALAAGLLRWLWLRFGKRLFPVKD